MLFRVCSFRFFVLSFLFKYTATTEIYTYCHTLSLLDALPIFCDERERDIVLAVPVDFETVAVVGNLTRRLRPRTPTQRGGMKVVRVCQVHNIIDEQTIVTLSADITIAKGRFGSPVDEREIR